MDGVIPGCCQEGHSSHSSPPVVTPSAVCPAHVGTGVALLLTLLCCSREVWCHVRIHPPGHSAVNVGYYQGNGGQASQGGEGMPHAGGQSLEGAYQPACGPYRTAHGADTKWNSQFRS